ncbi:MAG: glycosyltransferase family 1 protein [Actinomycetota bacterium]|uniref:glycosyltransferase family 4 protein n=1 Tax=Euzebya pacifica TaxID=1608957 RepID=UPI0030FA6602
MRVAIVTESFLPTVNGVSNSVARVTEELEIAGHEVLIVAPGKGPDRFSDSRVVRTAAMPLPGYQAIPVGMPTTRTYADLAAFAPDVMHIGGPVALGAWGLSAARRLGVPSVALYQTDFPRFARHYKVGAAEGLAWRWLRRIHSMAEVTLAPSSAAAWDLRRNGVPRVRLWGRGVDADRFHPCRRDEVLRAELAPKGEMLVGYVGRLAPEKNVSLLRALKGLPGVRLVVVGDGPDRQALQRALPRAHFTGYKGGVELSKLFASLDVFVHTGAHETFCQTIQEALSSGVPVVGPAVGGPLDLIRHGSNGLLYRPGDRRALRRAVAQLSGDPAGRAAMAARTRPGVEGRTWAALTHQLVGHYAQAMVGFTPEDAMASPVPSVVGL